MGRLEVALDVEEVRRHVLLGDPLNPSAIAATRSVSSPRLVDGGRHGWAVSSSIAAACHGRDDPSNRFRRLPRGAPILPGCSGGSDLRGAGLDLRGSCRSHRSRWSPRSTRSGPCWPTSGPWATCALREPDPEVRRRRRRRAAGPARRGQPPPSTPSPPPTSGPRSRWPRRTSRRTTGASATTTPEHRNGGITGAGAAAPGRSGAPATCRTWRPSCRPCS